MPSSRAVDPRRLDIAQAARDTLQLEGQWPLDSFERLREGDAAPGGEVRWSAQAGQRPVAGGEAEIRLSLQAQAELQRTCQRCLAPVRLPLDVSRRYLFVRGEDRAAELDAEAEDEDVLELTRSLDLHALVEDELLLALPLVPRHELCPEPLRAPDGPQAEAERPNPFAALVALRRGPPR